MRRPHRKTLLDIVADNFGDGDREHPGLFGLHQSASLFEPLQRKFIRQLHADTEAMTPAPRAVAEHHQRNSHWRSTPATASPAECDKAAGCRGCLDRQSLAPERVGPRQSLQAKSVRHSPLRSVVACMFRPNEAKPDEGGQHQVSHCSRKIIGEWFHLRLRSRCLKKPISAGR